MKNCDSRMIIYSFLYAKLMKNVITCKLSDVDVIFLYFFNLNCLSHVMITFVKYIYTVPVRAVLQCETVHFAS